MCLINVWKKVDGTVKFYYRAVLCIICTVLKKNRPVTFTSLIGTGLIIGT